MTLAEQAAYRNLLDLCWRDGSLPTNETALMRIAMATSDDWTLVRAVVLGQFFVGEDGRYHNEKVDSKRPEILEAKGERSSGNAVGGKKRASEAQRDTSGRFQRSQAADDTLDQQTSSDDPAPIQVATRSPSRSTPAPSPSPSPSPSPTPPPTPAATAANAGAAAEPDPGDKPADWAAELYGRHPKKRDKILAEGECARLWPRTTPDERDAITATHAAWCRTREWNEGNARFCPTLANWLRDEGYKREPDGQRQQAAPSPEPRPATPDELAALDEAMAAEDALNAEFQAALAWGLERHRFMRTQADQRTIIADYLAWKAKQDQVNTGDPQRASA